MHMIKKYHSFKDSNSPYADYKALLIKLQDQRKYPICSSFLS